VAHVRTLPKTRDGSRRYQVRYVGPDGRARAKNFGRKADADRFAATVETDKARGEWIDAPSSAWQEIGLIVRHAACLLAVRYNGVALSVP
jgi:hypothetical protein